MAAPQKTMVSCVLLLLGTGIGTGVLVLPKAMSAVGYVPMVVILAVGALTSAFTTWILFLAVAKYARGEFTETGNNAVFARQSTDCSSIMSLAGFHVSRDHDENLPSYADLLGLAMPSWTSALLDVVLICYGAGSIVAYLLFLSGFVHKLGFFPHWLGSNSRIMLMVCLVLPNTAYQSVGALSRLAVIGIIALVLMTIGILIKAPEAMKESHGAPFEAFADIDRLPAVTCICVFAFMWHTNCVCVARELRNPTPWRCAIVSLGGSVLLFLVYFGIAFGGYASWGETVFHQQSVVEMYPEDDTTFFLVRVILCASLLISTPLNVYPIRESMIGVVQRAKPSYRPTRTHKVLWGGGLVLGAAVTAIVFPDVIKVIQFLGGTMGSLIMIVWPACIAKLVFSRTTYLTVVVASLAMASFLTAAALGLIGRPS